MKRNKKDAETIGAFLGADSDFEGRLSFQGTIRIDGSYRGKITVDGTLIVGPTGRVKAEVCASNMIISGEVTGNMTAATNIEVHASGKVYGNLVAPTVTIHEGAVFQGHCHSGERRDNHQNSRAMIHPVVKDQSPAEIKITEDQEIKSA
jgi:cytoskeletal protein CcmA (bactofilin family)